MSTHNIYFHGEMRKTCYLDTHSYLELCLCLEKKSVLNCTTLIAFFFPLREYITKTCLHNFDPLKPHFYVVKLGLTGVFIIFLISAQKHRLWVSVRTASARRF